MSRPISYVTHRYRERVVIEIREDKDGRYECPKGEDTRKGRLMGIRTDVTIHTYRMPTEDFLRLAEIVE